MDILALVEGFEWDAGNACKSVDKRDVVPSEAEQVFRNEPLLLLDDKKDSYDEPRYHVYGQTDAGKLLKVIFMLRDAGRIARVVSGRPMSTRESARYADEP
ncbi:MAG: BrnT family toxin [Rhodospirillales bacterium]